MLIIDLSVFMHSGPARDMKQHTAYWYILKALVSHIDEHAYLANFEFNKKPYFFALVELTDQLGDEFNYLC